jgi:hypothetical protein
MPQDLTILTLHCLYEIAILCQMLNTLPVFVTLTYGVYV